jgi:hypothetical protein
MPVIRALTLCALLAGCAMLEPAATGETRLEGAARGAGKGALVCMVPMGLGLYLGPIGFVVGAYVTIICLPFGIAGGALSGAFPAAAQ